MVKARLVVEGVVQGVGFRAFIRQVASYHDLSGLVRNVEKDPKKVEMFCEGPRRKIEKFIEEIKRRGKPRKEGEPRDYFSIDVTSVECFWEGEEGYRGPWRKYEGFKVDYGVDELSGLDKFYMEDHEFGKLYFSMFGDEMKSFRVETKDNFSRMDKKYDKISDAVINLQQVPNELRAMRETIERIMEKFLKKMESK